jgi:hypothetical protein
LPGSPVGIVGTINLASLSDEWDFVQVGVDVPWLTVGSHPYVVLNPSETTISSSNFFQVPTSRSGEGTNGADIALLKITSGWETMSSLFGSPDFSYLHMVVWEPFCAWPDINQDGEINGLDVDPFVDLLLAGGYDELADMNCDGAGHDVSLSGPGLAAERA